MSHLENKESNNNTVEDIPELIPPGGFNRSDNKAVKHQSSLILWLLASLLIALLINIFILLKPDNTSSSIINAPKNNDEITLKKVERENIQTASPSPSLLNSRFKKPINKNGQSSQEQLDELEKYVNQWLILDAEAEQQHFLLWADRDITQARNYARQAEQYIRQSDYKQAKIHYQNAISFIEQARLSKTQYIKNELLKAKNLLLAQDWKKARKIYTTILEIDVDNKQAVYGLKRSLNLSKVIELYYQASDLLAQSDEKTIEQYNEIISMLEKAVDMDKDYLPAVKLLQQLKSKQRSLIFQGHISHSVQSMEKKKFASAREFLNRAREIEAQDPALKELENRIHAAEKSDKIKQLKQIALQKEKQEQWSAAIDRYIKILNIEPNTTFAIQGKNQAERFARWHKALDHIIEHPERLQSVKIRQHARRQLESIQNVSAGESVQHEKLKKKMYRARQLIEQSLIDINVKLRSDNNTQVEIYKVGRLGQFQQKTVILKPGQYTLAGSRPGYRDVRLVIHINANNKSPDFSIICMEKI